MTYQNTHDNELPFRSDFAASVFAEADAIATRRRKVRSAIVTVSAVLLIGAVSFGASQTWFRSAPEAQRVPRMIASIDSAATPFATPKQTTLLDIMFPHAAAVAQFSEEYAGETDALEDDAVFFPDAQDVAENDS
jgi:hypothetical protein